MIRNIVFLLVYARLRARAQRLRATFTSRIHVKTRIQSGERGTLVSRHATMFDRQRGLVHVYINSAEAILRFDIRWLGAQWMRGVTGAPSVWRAVHFHIGVIGFEFGFRVVAWGYASEPGDALSVTGGEAWGDEVVTFDNYWVEGYKTGTQDAEVDFCHGPEGAGAGGVVRVC